LVFGGVVYQKDNRFKQKSAGFNTRTFHAS
jgi:hypothetical protein